MLIEGLILGELIIRRIFRNFFGGFVQSFRVGGLKRKHQLVNLDKQYFIITNEAVFLDKHDDSNVKEKLQMIYQY